MKLKIGTVLTILAMSAGIFLWSEDRYALSGDFQQFRVNSLYHRYSTYVEARRKDVSYCRDKYGERLERASGDSKRYCRQVEADLEEYTKIRDSYLKK